MDERNLLILMLTRSASRRLFGTGWADEAKRMVAKFRTTHDLWANDPAFRELLQRLRTACPEFTAWWKSHEVRASSSGEKLLNHPTRGLIRFEHTSFQSTDDPALTLKLYTPIRC